MDQNALRQADSSNLHKQKLVKPKPLVVKKPLGLMVEYLFCGHVV